MLPPCFEPSHNEFSNPMRDAPTDLQPDSQTDSLADALADPFRRHRLSAALLSATGGALAMAGRLGAVGRPDGKPIAA